MPALVIRLDDITPDMNWDNFEAVKAILDEYDIKPLIGIVPDNQDPKLKVCEARSDFWEYMRQLAYEDWSIAQHGYRHIYETEDGGLLDVNHFSEFAGLPYDVQFEKLRKGYEIMREHGLEPQIFMAPGHTYDDTTRLALQQLKFRYVTDGYSDYPYIWDDIGYLPCTISNPKVPKHFDTLCLHVNSMTQEDLDHLAGFIRQNLFCIRDYLDVLDPDWFMRRKGRIARQEQQNLKRSKFKAKLATSPAAQEYMNRTNHPNKYVKLMKRAAGYPGMRWKMRKEKE